LSQLSKDKYENEVTETLEMTQIIDWDDENFFEASNDEEDKDKKNKDFDDDSFWENYDFDSVLN